MNSLIVYFLPSVLGTKLYSKLNKEKNKYEIFNLYLLLVLFSNLCSMVILIILKNDALNLFEHMETNYIFCVKYISLTLVFNVILVLLFTVITKYFYISIEVEHDKKGNNKKNNKK